MHEISRHALLHVASVVKVALLILQILAVTSVLGTAAYGVKQLTAPTLSDWWARWRGKPTAAEQAAAQKAEEAANAKVRSAAWRALGAAGWQQEPAMTIRYAANTVFLCFATAVTVGFQGVGLHSAGSGGGHQGADQRAAFISDQHEGDATGH